MNCASTEMKAKGNLPAASGLRGVIVAGEDGRIRCSGSLAIALLGKYFPRMGSSERLPVAIQEWLRVEAKRHRIFNLERNGDRLVVALVEGEAKGPHCLVLQESRAPVRPRPFDRTSLTPRETEVLSWVAQGKANWMIGKILNLSPGTVRKHLQNIYWKLGVENRTAAALCARDLI